MFEELRNLYEEHLKTVKPNWLSTAKLGIYDINGLPVFFPTKSKKILVALSGGADSSILTYMLCDLIKKNNFKTKIDCFTMIRDWETKPWNKITATNVFNYLKTQFPDIIGEHHWGFIPPILEHIPVNKLELDADYPPEINLDVVCTIEYQSYLLKSKRYDYVYSGVTTNPDEIIEGAPTFRSKDLIKQNIEYVIMNKAINPFALVKKNFTMAQYTNYKQASLLKLTRSCESNVYPIPLPHENMQTPDECGSCFYCQEKIWGIKNSNEYIIQT